MPVNRIFWHSLQTKRWLQDILALGIKKWLIKRYIGTLNAKEMTDSRWFWHSQYKIWPVAGCFDTLNRKKWPITGYFGTLNTNKWLITVYFGTLNTKKRPITRYFGIRNTRKRPITYFGILCLKKWLITSYFGTLSTKKWQQDIMVL